MTNIVVWGPMFLLGIFSLSDLLRPVTALYIQHGISNLHSPAYLFGAYKLFELAVSTGELKDTLVLTGFLIESLIAHELQRVRGAYAMYYLIDGDSEYADDELFPSIFYLLGWVEHVPRNHDPEIIYDYYY